MSASEPSAPYLRIGIDIGGTFTDFVVYSPSSGTFNTFKLFSTPDDPSRAVLEGIQRIEQERPPAGLTTRQIIHGSTVATNALLERKGARTALITTHGFRDVLQIGRQNRPVLYDLSFEPLPPLVPRQLRYEVPERIDHNGEVLIPLDQSILAEIIAALQRDQVQSIAVCLLFSFLNPSHELAIADQLHNTNFSVSLSHQILPEYREYERTSTTVINAYVSPILSRYLTELRSSLPNDTLQVMQSNGGMISVNEARQNGVRCILSGPAGGLIGAQHLAKQALVDQVSVLNDGLKLLTFDMGGTSTDVALIDRQPNLTKEAMVGGYPIAIPVLDIHTIGAGGGSIATIDIGGALRVGPQSAGADPGPACYGIGYLPTVTDANLLLGRIREDYFLGGDFLLDKARARKAFSHLAKKCNLSITLTALGVIDVINTHMERALRVISLERGYDPRDFTLLAFGGAGGLHAVDLARRLNIPRVLIPPIAAALSAYGMLVADIIKDYTQTVMLPGITPAQTINNSLEPLIQQGHSALEGEGADQISIECYLDMRYQGQSYEIGVPFSEDYLAKFHYSHQHIYGFAHPDKPVEIVNLHVRAIGHTRPPEMKSFLPGDPVISASIFASHKVYMDRRGRQVPFYIGESLQPGQQIAGPAVILRSDTTILLQSGDIASVDQYLNLLIIVNALPHDSSIISR